MGTGGILYIRNNSGALIQSVTNATMAYLRFGLSTTTVENYGIISAGTNGLFIDSSSFGGKSNGYIYNYAGASLISTSNSNAIYTNTGAVTATGTQKDIVHNEGYIKGNIRTFTGEDYIYLNYNTGSTTIASVFDCGTENDTLIFDNAGTSSITVLNPTNHVGCENVLYKGGGRFRLTTPNFSSTQGIVSIEEGSLVYSSSTAYTLSAGTTLALDGSASTTVSGTGQIQIDISSSGATTVHNRINGPGTILATTSSIIINNLGTTTDFSLGESFVVISGATSTSVGTSSFVLPTLQGLLGWSVTNTGTVVTLTVIDVESPPIVTFTTASFTASSTPQAITFTVVDNGPTSVISDALIVTDSILGSLTPSCTPVIPTLATGATSTCTVSISGDGNHVIQVVARDSFTRISTTTSASQSKNYIIDTIGPVFNKLLVDPIASGDLTNPQLVIIASDALSSPTTITYSVSGGATIATTTYTGTTTIPASISVTNILVATACDAIGNCTTQITKFYPIIVFETPVAFSSTTIPYNNIYGDGINTIRILAPSTGSNFIDAATSTFNGTSAPLVCTPALPTNAATTTIGPDTVLFADCIFSNATSSGTLTVFAESSGIPGPQSSVSLVVNIIAPNIIITAPATTTNNPAGISNTSINLTDPQGFNSIIIGGTASSTFSCVDTITSATITFPSASTDITCTGVIDTTGSITVNAIDRAGNPATPAAENYIVDLIFPTLTTITVPSTPDGTYGTSTAMIFNVTFSEPVTTPILSLKLNSGISATCDIGIVTATNTATCVYTVMSGEITGDLTVSSIVGTFTDRYGNAVTNTISYPDLATTRAIVIDGIALPPVITHVNSSSTPNGATFIQNNGTITIQGTGEVGATVTVEESSVSICTTTVNLSAIWSCTVLGVTSGLKNITATQIDTSSPANTSSPSTAVSFTLVVDTITPTLLTITSASSSATYKAGDMIPLTFTFSENITSTVSAIVSLNSGGSCTIPTQSIATTTVSCVYTVLTGESTAELTVNSIQGSFVDIVGNIGTNPVTVITLPASKTMIIDAIVAPQVLSSTLIGGSTSNTQINTQKSTTTLVKVDLSETCQRYLEEYIKLGARNNTEQVVKLQRFLNEYQQEKLTVDGVYKKEDELAVKRFQAQYKDEILAPWGLKYPTGFVYQTTQAKINTLVCGKVYGCPYFTSYHLVKDTGGDVKRIQNFINIIFGNDSVKETGVYDVQTKRYVERYQSVYKETVLKPWGLKKPTGRWYQTTRFSANQIMGCKEENIRLDNGSVVR